MLPTPLRGAAEDRVFHRRAHTEHPEPVMGFIADLHIHSPYSRATSKKLMPRDLYTRGVRKGIAVIGTSDFTHPAWLVLLREEMREDERELLRLHDDKVPRAGKELRVPNPRSVKFMLTCKISTIYKCSVRTRKVHHLICMPDFEGAARLAGTLDRIGIVRSAPGNSLSCTADNVIYISAL